jgi:hypothetical protein
MGQTHHLRRFKANPVEIAIFSIITVIFFNSIYNLLYQHKGFHPAALVPMTANPISEGRHLSSSSQTLLTWDVQCEQNTEKNTLSNRVRLNGPLCGADPVQGASKLIKATIINQANQYAATVFTDIFSRKFSTDYIPLSFGKNSIHIEFSYFDGTHSRQDLMINKN